MIKKALMPYTRPKGRKDKDLINKKEFEYNKELDVYVCPTGCILNLFTIKEISIKDYKPLSSSMINRHYYFIINISYEDNSDKRINKRYSEIEEFYKVLILKYPGCRIPQFPPKTFSISILIKEEDKKVG